MTVALPLAAVADTWLRAVAHASDSAALAALDGATLLGERATLCGYRIPGRQSAGGGCRLYDARGGIVALNLSRPDDRDLLPALFAIDRDVTTDAAVATEIATRDATSFVARGRLLGLAIAAQDDVPTGPAATILVRTAPASRSGRAPRILDLSALWAGPLAAHLLGLAGASVTRVDSRTRATTTRPGDAEFFDLLDRGKAGVTLDLHDRDDHAALLRLIDEADIVIEAARPRALRQLGIDAAALLRRRPGLTWITITAHGATGAAADWVGFGDDCGVAGGLSAALHRATGGTGFVGDAIADPLTGIHAARAAWDAWAAGGGVRIGITMAGTVAAAIASARATDAEAFDRTLVDWAAAAGAPFPPVARRRVAPPC